MKRIIIPTDFSKNAKNAFDYAIQYAKAHALSITLVHSVFAPVNWGYSSSTYPEAMSQAPQFDPNILSVVKIMEEQAFEHLKIWKEQAEKEKITCEIFLVKNKTIEDVLTEQIKNPTEELIIMGSHNKEDLLDELIDTNAQKVIRSVIIPVLTLKDKQPNVKINNLLYASSFEEHNLNETLHLTNKFAQMNDARLHLLYVNTPGNFEDSTTSINKLKKVAKAYDLKNVEFHIYNQFTIEQGIHDTIATLNPDMLIMPTHGYSGIRKIFNFNLAESMLTHTDTPIITIKEPHQ